MINLYTSIPVYKTKLKAPNSLSGKVKQSSANIQNDVFVKNTSNVSFGDNLTLMAKFVPFAKEIEDYVLKSSKLELSDIEKIIQRYSPTTKIKDFNELPQNSNAHNRTLAYFKQKINFTVDGEPIPEEKEIYIRLPKYLNKEHKLEFLDSIEHEFIHILQEESSDRVSKISFLNKFTQNGLDEEKIKTLQIMPQAFNAIEYNMAMPLYKFLEKENNMPIPIKSASLEVLDKIYQSMTGLTAEEYIKYIKTEIIKSLEESYGKFDKKVINDYVALISEKEYEAYKKTIEMLNKKCGISGSCDLDLRVVLYDVFKNVMLR